MFTGAKQVTVKTVTREPVPIYREQLIQLQLIVALSE